METSDTKLGLSRQLQEQERCCNLLEKEHQELQQQLVYLAEQIAKIQRQALGRQSKKTNKANKAQLSLFVDEPRDADVPMVLAPDDETS